MRSSSNSETEILLGNKHLLGIFFVIAILLGVAFTGGYMVGRNSTEKRPAMVPAVTPDAAVTPDNPSSSLETHSVPPPAGGAPAPAEPASSASPDDAGAPHKVNSHVTEASPPDAPLGSPKRKTAATPVAQSDPGANYLPRNGQTFLQVAAVRRNEADGIADVLNKKGFHAHSVAKPGNTAIYRVLIGPIRDTAELSSTRDELRKTGFRDVIVQRY
jgi:cell division septation protein DedD